MMQADSMLGLIKDQLLALRIAGLDARAIALESRLMEEIGVDSLKLVDLTVRIEVALAIPEFPMQRWLDACRARREAPTVGGLVVACLDAVERVERKAR